MHLYRILFIDAVSILLNLLGSLVYLQLGQLKIPPLNLFQETLHDLQKTAISHFLQITGSYTNKWQITH